MKNNRRNEQTSSAEDSLQTGSLASGVREDMKVSAFRDGHRLEAPGVTELNLSRMAQQREQTNQQAAQAAQELERLRGQREELERERQRLETLGKRQVKYEQDQNGLREGLTHRMELLRKMDLEASRRAELFAAVRCRYEEMLREVDQVRDQSWSQDRYEEDLNRALAIMEDIQREYSRAWSRVEAVSSEVIVQRPADVAGSMPVRVSEQRSGPRRFREWLLAGAAFSLPLITVMVVLFVLARWLWAGGA